jgi:hypothetical protein
MTILAVSRTMKGFAAGPKRVYRLREEDRPASAPG